jgi:hypothetical protein
MRHGGTTFARKARPGTEQQISHRVHQYALRRASSDDASTRVEFCRSVCLLFRPTSPVQSYHRTIGSLLDLLFRVSASAAIKCCNTSPASWQDEIRLTVLACLLSHWPEALRQNAHSGGGTGLFCLSLCLLPPTFHFLSVAPSSLNPTSLSIPHPKLPIWRGLWRASSPENQPD